MRHNWTNRHGTMRGWTFLVVAALAGTAVAARADRPSNDPVEELRNALKAPVDDYAKGSKDLKAREAELAERVRALRTVGDMQRALTLTEWRDIALEPALADVDRNAREAVVKRLEDTLRRSLKSDNPDAQLAAATFISALGPGIRESGAPRSITRRLTDDLVRLTQHGDVAVREGAARALGSITPDPKVAVTALGELLKANEVALRRAAAGGLVQLIEQATQLITNRGKSTTGVQTTWVEVLQTAAAVVPEAAAGLADPDAEVRRLSTQALQDATYTLFDYLFEPVKSSRLPEAPPGFEDRRVLEGEQRTKTAELDAVTALSQTLSDQVRAVARVLNDPDPRIRLASRRVLENMADARRRLEGGANPRGVTVPVRGRVPAPREVPDRSGRPPAPPGAEEQEQQPGNPQDASEASRLLREGLGRELELLAAGVRDRDVDVRLATVEVLELIGDAAAPVTGALVEALTDPNKFVRWAAARTLGKLSAPLRPPSAVPGLTRLLGDRDLDLRLVAAATLERYGPEARAAVPMLTRSVGRGDAEIRVAALRAIEGIGKDAAPAIPAITEALFQPNPRVRQTAAEVLGRFGAVAQSSVGALRRALDDPDADVRRAASEALLSIETPVADSGTER